MSNLETDIDLVFGDLRTTLLEKNRKYGDSAFKPIRVFSKANPGEQLDVRMDDKLSRINSGQADEDEDPEYDLLGYLILKRIHRIREARRLAQASAPDGSSAR